MRVEAAGINFADVMARAGPLPGRPEAAVRRRLRVRRRWSRRSATASTESPPATACWAAPASAATPSSSSPRAATLVPLPEGWSFEEGAAFPVNYATAYAGLCRYGAVHPGERVLLHAAAGGVGIAATQIAKLHRRRGLRHGLGVQARRDPRLRRRPPDRLPHQDFVKEVRRITGEKQPLDLVMDAVGGAQLPQELLAAAARRAAGLLRRLVAGHAASGATCSRALQDGRRTPPFNPCR